MKIVSESKYCNRIYTCPNCEIQFQLELEDLCNITYFPSPNRYERNLPKNSVDAFYQCKCLCYVPIETWKGENYTQKQILHGQRKLQ